MKENNNRTQIREKIAKLNPDAILWETMDNIEVDSAIKGISYNFADKPIAVYDMLTMLELQTNEIIKDSDVVEEYREDYIADLQEDHCDLDAKDLVLYYMEEEYALSTRTTYLGEYTPLLLENPENNMNPKEIKLWLKNNGEPFELLDEQFDDALIGIGWRPGQDSFFAVYNANKILTICQDEDPILLKLKNTRKEEYFAAFVFDI